MAIFQGQHLKSGGNCGKKSEVAEPTRGGMKEEKRGGLGVGVT